jgi:maltose alpha-D-glucosyltransferase/alpha-amylase
MTSTPPTPESEPATWDVTWPALLAVDHRPRFAKLILDYVRDRRWFRAKTRTPRAANLADVIPFDASSALVLLRIEYETGEADLYAVPLGYVDGQAAASLLADAGAAHAIIARLGATCANGALVDGLLVPGLAAEALFAILRQGARAGGERGEVAGAADPLFGEVVGTGFLPIEIPRVEQTNSTAIFGKRVLLKIYRELTAGPNPELELGRYLTSACDPPLTPRVLGALWYRVQDDHRTAFNLGIAHEYLRNDGDAWTLALREVRATFATIEAAPDRAVDRSGSAAGSRGGVETLLARALEPEPEPNIAAAVTVGGFLARAATLGRRTGELHLALARAGNDPDFAPEPLSADDRRAMAGRAQAMLNAELDALPALLSRLTPQIRIIAQRLLDPSSRHAIASRFEQFCDRAIDVVKTRIHGDLHLGQVLCRGEDFVIIDFEGEPARPLSERRAKSSPLRDVMGMVRSFDYAPQAVLRDASFEGGGPGGGPERARRLETWAGVWTAEVTAAYLRGYLTTVAAAAFIPRARDELALLLGFHELEKVIYEIRYEANHRPDWLEIPLRGLAAIVGLRGQRQVPVGDGR